MDGVGSGEGDLGRGGRGGSGINLYFGGVGDGFVLGRSCLR